MHSILIVKTSSLGDIIQSFHVLNYLKAKYSDVQIDWVAAPAFASLVEAHPLVHKVHVLDFRGPKKQLLRQIFSLRSQRYDLVFDLQRNTKSGLITALVRSSMKVGFGRHSVREWPNMLATHKRFDVCETDNIRAQYLGLLQKYFGDPEITNLDSSYFKVTLDEQQVVASILRQLKQAYCIMVCPGSRWINKQLPLETLQAFLAKIAQKMDVSFLFTWGDAKELQFCQQLQASFGQNSIILDKLSLPVWQNLMNEVDLVIAIDSAALHLCGTTRTPSFSIFGPTSPSIFKPLGQSHFAMQGPCPYGRTFSKQCPILRTCKTGACIRQLDPEIIFQRFWDFYIDLSNRSKSM